MPADLFLTLSHPGLHTGSRLGPQVTHGMQTGTGVAPDAHGADYFHKSASRELKREAVILEQV